MTELYQGETKRLSFIIEDLEGAPQDLTGATVTWRLSKSFALTTVLEKSASIISAVGGEVRVELLSADTQLPPGGYVHELRVALGDTTITVFQGQLLVLASLFPAA